SVLTKKASLLFTGVRSGRTLHRRFRDIAELAFNAKRAGSAARCQRPGPGTTCQWMFAYYTLDNSAFGDNLRKFWLTMTQFLLANVLLVPEILAVPAGER